MKTLIFLALTFFLSPALQAQTAIVRTNQTGEPAILPIDLPTVLRLANVQNLDVQIARQRSLEAQALHESAEARFFPWLSPGIAFQRRDGLAQDTPGNIVEVHKQSYAPGFTFNAQVELGDALYGSLAARQIASAAVHGLEAQRQISALAAAAGYFDLLQAQAAVAVAEETRKILQDYERQIRNAVEAGIAFKGDQLRVQVQGGQSETALRRAREQQRLAAARLAETLHLDPAVELIANDQELVPLSLIETNAALSPMVAQALARRPELRQSHELFSAAGSANKGAVYGPLIPTLGGQAYLGGFGGGMDHTPGHFGEAEEFTGYLSWRVGPGGLLDSGRKHQTEARLESARLTDEKLRDQVIRQVVENLARFRSLSDQLGSARQTVASALEAQKLAEQRKQFGVGVVLEDILTQQELARARNDYAGIIAEFDKAQYALQQAVGGLVAGGGPGNILPPTTPK